MTGVGLLWLLFKNFTNTKSLNILGQFSLSVYILHFIPLSLAKDFEVEYEWSITISAIMVTVSKNTVHSVFFLILDFISISCLFIMIGAEFLGMIMLIVYVGAVAVLFLFVVMMLNVAQQKNQWFSASESSKHIPVGLIVSSIIFFELIIVISGWKFKPDLVTAMSLTIDQNITNTHSIGYVLYTDYIHIFQISGMILLVAMIGAIVLTFRQRSGVKKQSYLKQISRERSEGVELINVESNKGVKSDD